MSAQDRKLWPLETCRVRRCSWFHALGPILTLMPVEFTSMDTAPPQLAASLVVDAATVDGGPAPQVVRLLQAGIGKASGPTFKRTNVDCGLPRDDLGRQRCEFAHIKGAQVLRQAEKPADEQRQQATAEPPACTAKAQCAACCTSLPR